MVRSNAVASFRSLQVRAWIAIGATTMKHATARISAPRSAGGSSGTRTTPVAVMAPAGAISASAARLGSPG